MLVTRDECMNVLVTGSPQFDLQPLQIGLCGCPWRVAVASMLLCRARYTQAQPVLKALLGGFPAPAYLARANADLLEHVVKPCGFQRNRARQLSRFSAEYMATWWTDLRELTGVGDYVSDAVGLFCFGRTDLQSNDGVLHDQVKKMRLLQIDVPAAGT